MFHSPVVISCFSPSVSFFFGGVEMPAESHKHDNKKEKEKFFEQKLNHQAPRNEANLLMQGIIGYKASDEYHFAIH